MLVASVCGRAIFDMLPDNGARRIELEFERQTIHKLEKLIS
jgi:hypothetical protein